MRWSGLRVAAASLGLLMFFGARSHAGNAMPQGGGTNVRSFDVRGVVREVKPQDRTAVIRHEAIPNYMEAMTMPFKVRDAKELDGLQAGDEIAFRFHVTETRSWIDGITRVGRAGAQAEPAVQPEPGGRTTRRHPLLDYPFTNELGQAVSLGGFRGRALAITFIFTRCPVPDYCPRLSKNFQEAARLIRSTPGAPTNWHFLSVTIDPEFDTPAVLKAYGEQYQYDPDHWSFLTGPADKIAELARLSDVSYEATNGLLSHNFRTLIVDPSGRRQAIFPTSGDLSEAIASEVLKAAGTNPPAAVPGENRE